MTIHVQYARCWSCMAGSHYETPTAHTWMDDEDANAYGLSWPLTAEQKSAHPCACTCAGGPGGCVTLPSIAGGAGLDVPTGEPPAPPADPRSTQ